jgi:saccharopine dehydrogenase-like NADP-dependent oxidoreductase
MQVLIRGMKNGLPKEYCCTLYDRYHKATNTMSMARTTGYTCTAAARLLADQKFTRTGICPPEFLGQSESCFKFVTEYLMRKEISIRFDEKTL